MLQREGAKRKKVKKKAAQNSGRNKQSNENMLICVTDGVLENYGEYEDGGERVERREKC